MSQNPSAARRRISFVWCFHRLSVDLHQSVPDSIAASLRFEPGECSRTCLFRRQNQEHSRRVLELCCVQNCHQKTRFPSPCHFSPSHLFQSAKTSPYLHAPLPLHPPHCRFYSGRARTQAKASGRARTDWRSARNQISRLKPYENEGE